MKISETPTLWSLQKRNGLLWDILLNLYWNFFKDYTQGWEYILEHVRFILLIITQYFKIIQEEESLKESIRKTEMYLLNKGISVPIKSMHESIQFKSTLPKWKKSYHVISITRYLSSLIVKPSLTASERRSRWRRLRVKFDSVRYNWD